MRYNAHPMMSWAKLGLSQYDARGQGTQQIRPPCLIAGGTRPVFRPADASTAIAEFGNCSIKEDSLL